MKVRLEKEVDVRHEVDVFVAGGGPAGIAAAVTAARAGAKVFLAEGGSAFGGMGTLGLVPAFMPLGDGERLLCAGIGTEVLRRMLSPDGAYDATLPLDPGIYQTYSIEAEKLKRCYDEMVVCAGMGFSFNTQVVDVAVSGDRIDAVILWGKSGFSAVKAKVYVDATGDGDLCAFAGAPFEKGDGEGVCMPGTLCTLWHGVRWDEVVATGNRWNNGKFVEQAFKDGVLTHCDKHHSGVWPQAGGVVGGNVGHAFGLDSTDERSVTAALVEGRRKALEYQRYYRKYVKNGFDEMTLVATAPAMGVRESRRIMGDYVLGVGDYNARADFDDEIGRNNYYIDIHIMKPGSDAEVERFKKESTASKMGPGESYGIPYRALIPRGLSNALVAGRCISCDRPLQASLRVMPCCFVTGQGAGMAAALAADAGKGVRDIDIQKLKNRLAAVMEAGK